MPDPSRTRDTARLTSVFTCGGDCYFITAGFGLAFLDFLAYLSGGFVLAGVFAVVVIVLLNIRAAFVASRRPSQPVEDEQP